MESMKALFELMENIKESINQANEGMKRITELVKEARSFLPGCTTFAELRYLLDRGEITLEVGDHVCVKNETFGMIDWTVIGVGADGQRAIGGDKYRPVVTLHMTHCLEDYRWFSEPSKKYPWGHNAWDGSHIRWWLNSTFIDGFSDEDKDALAFVRKTTYRNDEDGGEKYETADKIFLLSASEMGFTGSNIKDEGEAYPFYDGHPEHRCKTDAESGAESYYWLRSPYPSSASNVRHVLTDGSLSHGDAHLGVGAAAACAI